MVLERDVLQDHNWNVPAELEIPADQLRCRVDFFHQAVRLTIIEGDTIEKRLVSAQDVVQALASELSYGTGLLPPNALWWQNTKAGAMLALYEEPRIRRVALQRHAGEPPQRYSIPLPGLVFICRPSKPPWVFAVKKRPTKTTDVVFNAPLCNVFENGNSCPGNHKYPARVADIIHSFFVSFFSPAGDRTRRSHMFPNDVIALWEYLDGKKKYPFPDLVPMATIKDLMKMEYHS